MAVDVRFGPFAKLRQKGRKAAVRCVLHQVPVRKPCEAIAAFRQGEDRPSPDLCNKAKLRDLNRNIAVLIDSDKDKPRAQLKPVAKRLRDEMSKDGGIVWITKGREIENYVPHEVMQETLKVRHTKVYGAPSAGGAFDHAFYFERKNPKAGAEKIYTNADKVGAATIICGEDKAVDFGVLDLKERVTELGLIICDANGMERMG